MNRYTLHKAGINISEGMDRLKLDKTTFEGLLLTFAGDKSFDQMLKAIDEKNVSEAFLHAHSLKGLSANLSLSKLNLDIVPLVTILREGSFEHTDELILQVKESYQLVIDTLKLESQMDKA